MSEQFRDADLIWPSIETEEWRYSPIGELSFDDLVPATAPPDGFVVPASAAAAGGVGAAPAPDQWAARVTVVDGFVTALEVAPGWAEKGLEIVAGPPSGCALEGLSETAPSERLANEAELTAFDQLHTALSPATLVVRTPTGLTVRDPIVIRSHHATVGAVSFPHLRVEAGDGSDLLVVEEQTSVDGLGVSVPRVELVAAPSARLRYQVLQDLSRQHWQLGRQRSTAAGQATLVSGVAAFGGRYARLRTDSALVGRGASATLVAAYYGDGSQVHDFRTFQHHQARNTRSDLLYKGAQDGSSGSIYTGMIHIHPDGGGSNAFQTNRNVKLSPEAWAWSVPNLEIENNDVRCSHASTVSPVDEEQRFYLQARGVPPVAADRLIVAGFFDEVIERLPAVALREGIRRRVAAKLDTRGGEAAA